METNGAKSRPHVFKRIMNLSDMQLNVIYLQRIEEFEKNPFEDSSEYSNCKNTCQDFSEVSVKKSEIQTEMTLLLIILSEWNS